MGVLHGETQVFEGRCYGRDGVTGYVRLHMHVCLIA